MKIKAILPVLSEEMATGCIASMVDPHSSFGFTPEDILVVDNSQNNFAKEWGQKYGVEVYRDPDNHNLGVARAWNVGAHYVVNNGLDYLVIVSASMLFGPFLYHTFKGWVNKQNGEIIIEAQGHGWHLIAIHRLVFEKVGYFDENFYPAYYEDVDFGRRMMLAGYGGWDNVWINAISRAIGFHGQFLDIKPQALMDYYISKWGGGKGEETFELPFGDKPLDYWQERSVSQLSEKYNLQKWW